MSMTKGQGSVVALTLVATLGGLLFGYDTAVISGAVTSIDANFIDPLGLEETQRNILSGFAVSSALVGCVVGGGIGGWVGNRFGRRGGLIAAAILFLVSAVGSAYPELGWGTIGAMGPKALVPFICYRILCGVGVGMASMLSPLYIAEIAPPERRGRLVSYNQMAIVGGIVGVYFVNWIIATQGDQAWLDHTGWRYMLGSEALPAALFLVLLTGVPDTPRWLVLKGRRRQALDVLERLMPEAAAQQTLADIEGSLVHHTDKLLSFGGKVVLIGIMLSVFQQLVGINAVLYYAPMIFQTMGAANDSAFLQTVIVGAANVLFTLVAMVTVDRWGRRPLLIWGGGIMAVAMFWLGAVFNLQALGAMALGAMLLYIAGFAMSWGPVVWVLLSEIFPNAIKGQALALAVAAQWIANVVVTLTFKVMDGSSLLNNLFHHGFSYYVYGAMSVASALFVYFLVPETKGRKLEEIQELWHKG
jgi:SP family xylose:H+ symportor-like MFS transporter